MADINTVADLVHMVCPNCGGRSFELSTDAVMDGFRIVVDAPRTYDGSKAPLSIFISSRTQLINEHETAMCNGCSFEHDILQFDVRNHPVGSKSNPEQW